MTTKTADPQIAKQPSPTIETRDQLIASFARGEKPAERWRIGTEHEKFVYRLADHRAPSYDEPGGIRDLLGELEQHGWRPVTETGTEGTNVIALSGADGSVSLEPAGSSSCRGRRSRTSTRPARRRAATSIRSRRRATSWGSASSASACGPTRPAPSCR